MIGTNRISRRTWQLALIFLLIAAVILPGFTRPASAGKEGVFLNDEVYFTLEEVMLSQGSDTQTFRFALELVNNSEYTLDYNSFGAAVRDGEGNRYTAELAEKTSAKMKPGTATRIKYTSKIPAGISLHELKTEIFQWDFSEADYMRALGALSVASAASVSESDKPQLVLNLNDVDTSYAVDAMAAFQVEGSYKVLVGGAWSVYTHVTVQNLGSESFKLPTSLQYTLKDEDGLSYSGSVAYGGDKSVLPHQGERLLLQFPVGDKGDSGKLTMEISKKGSSSGSNGQNNSQNGGSGSAAAASMGGILLGALDITNTLEVAALKEERDYPSSTSGLKAIMESVAISSQSDGVHVESVWKLKNTGSKAVSAPGISGVYQLSGSALTVNATDSLSHPDYLAAGETTEYRFKAVLPTGVDSSSVQLAVMEKKGANPVVQLPVFLGSLPEGGIAGSGPVNAGGNAYLTSAGKLALTAKTSYRLMTEGGEDVLMTELQVENLETRVITLPSLYASYTDGNIQLEGKAIRVQSFAFLNPGQKTTLYLYAKLPYSLELKSGDLVIGEGAPDTKTNSLILSKEWAKLPFTAYGSPISTVSFNQDWFVPDMGRQSTARVIDSKVYETASGTIAAVRIAQKNQESRANGAVPYAGYYLDPNQSVWMAKTTEDTGRVCKDCWTVSTLWTALPYGMTPPTSLVFGQKLDDKTFGAPRQVTLSSWTGTETHVKMDDYEGFKAELLPYHVNLTGMSHTLLNRSYTFNFTYKANKDFKVTVGSSPNRYISFTLEDGTGKVYKNWDIPLEGAGSFEVNAANKLTIDNLDVTSMINLINSAKITVQEKFEGGVRMLGTISAY